MRGGRKVLPHYGKMNLRRTTPHLTYNMVVGDSLDREQYIAFQILDYALCSAPGAPPEAGASG